MKFIRQVLAGALLSAAAASSMAAVIYSQDFSKGLQSNETISGPWSITDGKLYRGVYQNNEKNFFTVKLDLGGFKDIHLSYDYWTDSERNWDSLQLYTVDSLNRRNRIHYATGTFAGKFSGTLNDSIRLLEFSFTSDASNTGKGASVDNILITGTSIAPPPKPVPEPGPVALMGIGLAALVLRRRGVRRSA
jgi:hypothetical protein